MGLNAASVQRFRTMVDKVLCEMFPAVLVIEGLEVASSGPGGKTVSDYMEGGQSENFRFPFRIPRAACPVGWTPRHGISLEWKISDTETLALEIIQAHVHPHEDVWEAVARKRR
jgi:hypothetical protein